MSLAKRIIPCLDIQEGRVVKGVNFLDIQDAGDPVEIAQRYNMQGADELVFLDITATHQDRSLTYDVLKKVAKNVFIPLCVGGGVKELQDFYRLLETGCDKVSINSAALANPNLITQAAQAFGSQCVVVAMDIKWNAHQQSWNLYTHGGRKDSGIDLLQWAKEVSDRGAGEILLTSMDADGTKNGFDLKSLQALNTILQIPIILSGGAGTMEHFKEAFIHGADAALAASVFHYQEIHIQELKLYLKSEGICVRF
ncbi:imidazole glycerol phosphate synthase subunit HisF [Helicobacter monodelphidis]|uniref:imidazole glycerol phosphate synthase subunit HisF n=1 Tax=Helicobacter sp. 15-1451 TaxID=2004995 RepID=UPI000DCCC30E|nr:imidazole glycerol phosphate synthase subunit HisF [Helicobacter sp. 15-1451]RAX58043.1 imidazole glycerol phosphate synthase subunit HisF [Helicobacter sp. 15-1451]